MNKTSTTSGQASDIIIEGLAEMTNDEARQRLASVKVDAARSEKAKAHEQKKFEENKVKMIAKRDGTFDSKLNPKHHHNPQILPDTLRQAVEGEEINDRPAKGWVVTIECETCGEAREINTQDAFQVRFCEEHKAEASKARANAKAVAEVAQLSDEEVFAELSALAA